jgi:glutaredoxin domain-containing cysteine-rich protein 1
MFHINEKDDIPPNPIFDENFAGVRVIGSEQGSNSSTSTIRSHRGTIRGVKNRVRAGIATFLRDQKTKVNHL